MDSFWALENSEYHTNKHIKKEKRVTEDEMVGWHHQCNGHELGQTPGDAKRQGSLACCCSWSREESDMT